MGAFTRARIDWTETDRVLLVRTVMHVEEEIMSKSDIEPVVQDSILGRIKKWKRINSLLPPKLQSRRWSCNRKAYDYKCRDSFQSVLNRYRTMKAKGLRKVQKGNRCQSLTQPVYDIMKKREDFLNGRRSIESTVIHSKSGASNIGYGCTRSYESESSMGEGLPLQLNNNVEETEKNDSHLNRRGDCMEIKNGRSIMWTEKARLLVIKAVIQVEEEIIKTDKDPFRSSCLKGKEKWDRINALLPPHLQGKNPNFPAPGSRKHRCRSLFNNLVMAYKSYVDQERPKDVHHRMLTKPIQEMMKKREDLLNHYLAMRAERSSKSRSPAKLKTCTPLTNWEQLQATGKSSLGIKTKQGNSSGRRLRGKAPDHEAGSFFKHTSTQSKRKLGALQFDSKLNGQESHGEGKRSRERHDRASFRRRCATRSVTMAEASGCRRSPVRSRKSAPKSAREYSEHSQDLGEPSAQTGAQPRAQTHGQQRGFNSSPMPAAIYSLSSSYARQSSSKADVRYDDPLQPILDKSLQRIDQEFSRLGSWVQNRAILIARQGFTEMTSPAIRSDGAWCNVNAVNAFDEFLHQSTSRGVDLCVQTSFQKLRVRLAEEVKHTAVEVAQEVLRGIDLLLNFHAHPKNN